MVGACLHEGSDCCFGGGVIRAACIGADAGDGGGANDGTGGIGLVFNHCFGSVFGGEEDAVVVLDGLSLSV